MRVLETNKLESVIIVGDRVLIKPKTAKEQTKSGLFLPPGVQEKEKVQEGQEKNHHRYTGKRDPVSPRLENIHPAKCFFP